MKKTGCVFLLLMLFVVSIFIVSNIKNITNRGVINNKGELRRDTPLAVDEDYLYTLTEGNLIVKYDKHDGLKKSFSKYSEINNDISNHVRDFAVDDQFLYVISWNGNIYVYNKTSLDGYATINGHSSRVMALYLAQDYIYTGSYDCSLKVWNKTDFNLVDTFSLQEGEGNQDIDRCCKVNSIAVDGKRVYIGCEYAYALVVEWDKKEIYKIEFVGDTSQSQSLFHVESISFDDNYIYFIYDRFLVVLDKSNLSLVRKIPFSNPLHIIRIEKEGIVIGGRDGFFLLNKLDFIPLKIRIPQQEWGIHNIILDENNIYLGSPQNNILIIDRNSKKFNTLFEIS